MGLSLLRNGTLFLSVLIWFLILHPPLLIHSPVVPNVLTDNNVKMVLFSCALYSMEAFSCLHNALVSSVLSHLWKHGKCEETGVLVGAAAVCSWSQNPTFCRSSNINTKCREWLENSKCNFLNWVPLKFLMRVEQFSDWKVEKLVERTKLFFLKVG